MQLPALQARVVELISAYVAVPIQVEECKDQVGSVACHFGPAEASHQRAELTEGKDRVAVQVGLTEAQPGLLLRDSKEATIIWKPYYLL